ncbi:FGGY-family carbohydrate kinase [Cellulomonas sp. ATA003]|uniref:FGGY-family carbohydrate kinase n=1 Tax=Cellulomonas sp. ATA003 TaxID=3073064 RepID=UPI002872C92B|nr:FGGY-family carbohydrate kinase [Cellulomonas sp. ATA003]WNB86605.1 FGGY-family carbohydrate kinase [Cellulomonas sp. ATA003]
MVGDVHAFLTLRLTGRWATSDGSADTLGLFDLRRTAWSPELLALAGLRPEQMPDLVPVGEPIADLLPDVAAGLGLPGPVTLVSGIGDGQAAGLGLGATTPGVAYLNLGTSMVMGVQSADYRWDPAFRTLAGMQPGTYTLETVLNAAAYVATWCREQFGARGLDGLTGPAGAELEAAAAVLPPGAEGLLTVPYWNAAQTPYWDPRARGATVGWHGRHTAAHLYRSILEGVGFELRLHLERLEAVTSEPVRVIRVVGGGGRSPLWTQIVADITGRPVRVCADAEWSAAGAGVLARAYLDRSADAGASGAPGGPAGAPVAVAEPAGRDVLPDPPTVQRYEALAAVHRRIYPALRDLFGDLLEASAEPAESVGPAGPTAAADQG